MTQGIILKKKLETQVAKIEDAQDALRQSIEATKVLAEKADNLVQQHKENLKKQLPDD
ncbi:MAG: DUF2321 domain-containing protein [Pseudomonadota bacterium]|nr:DUF2321 domain-containing protein [Pseudomonadota bacterium]